MSPPPDGVNAQSRWPCRTASRTYSLYRSLPSADVLAPSIDTKTSAATLLSVQGKQVLVFQPVPRGVVPTTCAISVLINDRKYKYIFIFPKKKFSTRVKNSLVSRKNHGCRWYIWHLILWWNASLQTFKWIRFWSIVFVMNVEKIVYGSTIFVFFVFWCVS